MPVASTIAISDSTPTSHDFDPRGDKNGVMIYKNTESDTGAGQMVLGLSLSDASASRPTHRVTLTLAVPVEQTVDGLVEVAHVDRFQGIFIMSENTTATARADLLAYAQNALANAQVVSAVSDLDPPW